jgi:hypothetical protein
MKEGRKEQRKEDEGRKMMDLWCENAAASATGVAHVSICGAVGGGQWGGDGLKMYRSCTDIGGRGGVVQIVYWGGGEGGGGAGRKRRGGGGVRELLINVNTNCGRFDCLCTNVQRQVCRLVPFSTSLLLRCLGKISAFCQIIRQKELFYSRIMTLKRSLSLRPPPIKKEYKSAPRAMARQGISKLHLAKVHHA